MKTYISLMFTGIILFTACKPKQQAPPLEDAYYTCSMHPQIMEDHPGTCPICHMDLIIVPKTHSAVNEIILNEEQIKLGNIQSDTLRAGLMGDQVILTGTLNIDESRVTSINARIMGRIDRLYIKTLGTYVRKGTALFDLYSEELNNAQQEYIIAVEKQQSLDNSIIDFSRLVESAKTKLQLWGMNESQLNQLLKAKKPSQLTTFYSEASGYVIDLPVIEGQYVTEGSTIAKLADLSMLWVEAQVYASQISGIDMNGKATVQIPDLPGKVWQGNIQFANPQLATDLRLNLIRISVSNTNGQLKPGMAAYVIIKNKEVHTLTLPSHAVLRDGTHDMVWVQTGPLNFKLKMVDLGLETDDRIEIKSGLEPGELVVTSGAYLLYSEYVFKKGGNTMADMEGMDMGAHQH